MTIFKAARMAALLAGGSVLATATPSVAQQRQNQQAQQPANAQQQVLEARFRGMSRAEQQALRPLLQAVVAANQARQGGGTVDWGPVRAALPAAQAAARSNQAKFFVTQAQLDVAIAADDLSAQEAALAALARNPVLTPPEQASIRNAQSIILNKRAEQAYAANDYATAERLYREILQANPNDQRVATNLRIVQERGGNSAGALQGIQQQIRQAEAAGQRATEDLYRRAFEIPYRARQRSEAVAGVMRLARAYPTATNWRTALDVVRENARNDDQYLLDTYRFARAANVIQGSEYLPLAGTLDQAGLPGEVKAVIDAGVAAGAVQRTQADVARLLGVNTRRIGEDRTGLPAQIQQARSAANGRQARIVADVLYGYGRYQEAADLYRVALSKGGEDPNLVNTRLGASLAMAGQRAEAEAALRAVTGNRAELAALWLAWLGRQG
jgi:tetratricopeptide (TPR) repeat protein